MKDNGLLKYYKIKRVIDGRISISSLTNEVLKNNDERFGHCIIDGKKYFVKDKYPTNRGDSAEVLLSQIYAKAGFDTALYFPAALYGELKNCLLCQDIKGERVISPGLFDYPLTNNQAYYTKELYDIPQSEIKNSIYFSKDAVRQIIKMHVFDLASKNADRNKSNYYLKINEDNIASGVKLIDYGFSAYYDSKLGFYNDFSMKDLKNREDMVDFFKNDKTISAFVFTKEIGKELGKVDIWGTCLDIKEQTGYRVDREFAEEMQESFFEVSQQLIK